MADVNPPPTTTTYAILGQLAWGEVTTYELVKAMRRNLRYLWPRAESRIYQEVRRLVDAGFAVARPGVTGKRRRTTYSITPSGLAALRSWLAGRERLTVTVEHEPLLRVFLAGQGRPDDLLAAVAAARASAQEMLAIGRPLAGEYVAGAHPQQHEVHLRALVFDFLYRWALLTSDWADRAEREIATWQTLAPDPDKHARALHTIRTALGTDPGLTESASARPPAAL